jgi:hypothetical protein
LRSTASWPQVGFSCSLPPRRHAFSFLDPDNAKFRFPRFHRLVNLATDHTFLFRAPEVTRQKHVDPGDIAAALGKLEDIKRGDPRWLPRYSDFRYFPGHFSELVQRDVPCAESQLKLMIHARSEIGAAGRTTRPSTSATGPIIPACQGGLPHRPGPGAPAADG